MTPTEMILIAILVAAGVALVGLLLIRGEERSHERADWKEPPEPEPSSHDPVQRLSETLQALRNLSVLRDEENAQRQPFLSQPSSTIEAPSPGPEDPLVAEKREPDAAEPQRDLRILVGEVFTPSAPVSRRDLFAGRAQQMEDLVDTVYERGQHAVIYGERGVGKTSLASVMTRVFDGRETPLGVRINCDSSDTYTLIWRKIFEQLMANGARFIGSDTHITETVSELATQEEIHPNDVRRGLDGLARVKECVLFVDEFDTLRDPEAPRLFADTIKMLSDQLVATTVVLIGVADDLDELIEEHASVRRALVQIYMPRMSAEELAEIVNGGLELLNMKCESSALDRITHLSHGFPHYTHLLAQASARAAIEANRSSVELDDVNNAISRVLDRVHQSIREAYEMAVSTSQTAIYAPVLAGAALARLDERGFFTAAGVKGPLSTITGKKYEAARFLRHLNAMCEPQRGPALQRKGADRHIRYRFGDPLLQPYVLMRGIQSGLITDELLETYSRPSHS